MRLEVNWSYNLQEDLKSKLFVICSLRAITISAPGRRVLCLRALSGSYNGIDYEYTPKG